MKKRNIRRDWLKRQIEKGGVQIKCDYHYTDDYAQDAADNFGRTGWLPARISKPKYEIIENEWGGTSGRIVDRDVKEGFINLRESHFEGSSGAAWRDSTYPGRVILLVHQNLAYSIQLPAEG